MGSRLSGLEGPAGDNAVPQARRDGACPLRASGRPPLPSRLLRHRALTSAVGQKRTCRRHVGRVIALSIEPFYNPNGRRVLLAREQRRLAAIVTADVVGYAHAVYGQIYYSSLMPRTYLCERLL